MSGNNVRNKSFQRQSFILHTEKDFFRILNFQLIDFCEYKLLNNILEPVLGFKRLTIFIKCSIFECLAGF